MNRQFSVGRMLLVWGFLVLCSSPAASLLASEKPDDAQALQGIKTGKVAWDINAGEPKKLKLYLSVMEETYEDLKRQGVEPEMIFTFRGPAVRLVSSDRTDVPLDQEADYDAVAGQIKKLLTFPNVRMEACSVAARIGGINPDSMLPGVELVGNTFVSQIGYQAQGYATIPIF